MGTDVPPWRRVRRACCSREQPGVWDELLMSFRDGLEANLSPLEGASHPKGLAQILAGQQSSWTPKRLEPKQTAKGSPPTR